MGETVISGAGGALDSQCGSEIDESAVSYKQITYEELEECVLSVRDSISEFYLAPQGEISFAAVEAALRAQTGAAAHDAAGMAFYAGTGFSIYSGTGGSIFGGASAYNGGASAYNAGASAYSGGAGIAADQADGSEKDRLSRTQPEMPGYFGGQAVDGGAPGTAQGGEDPPGGEEEALGDAEAPAASGDTGDEADASELVTGAARPSVSGIARPSAYSAAHMPGSGTARLRFHGAARTQYHTSPIDQLYRENIKKKAKTVKKRGALIFQYLLPCFLSAITGGLLAILCIMLILPMLGISLIPSNANPVLQEIVHKYEIEKIESPIEAIYEKVSPSIVGIRVHMAYNDFFFGQQQATAEGSGVIIHSDGYIITNNSVIASAVPMYMPIPPGRGSSGSQNAPELEVVIPGDPNTVYIATLVSRDIKTDIAVIKIDAVNLTVAELGDSDQLRPGEPVIAIGSPGSNGDSGSVTDGIISGFNRGSKTKVGLDTGFIQTNAAINPGNSGGALVNSKGQVIGINVLRSDVIGYDGLGFAIPINSARSVADSLIEFSYVRGRAKTGIQYSEAYNVNYEFNKLRNPDLPKGVYVEYVEPLSGAFKAGLREGDIIVKMGGVTISDYIEMLEYKETLTPGDIIEVEFYRAGEYYTAELEASEETGD